MKKLVLVFIISFFFSCEADHTAIKAYVRGSSLFDLDFGINKLREALSANGMQLTMVTEVSEANFIVNIDTSQEQNDGYQLKKRSISELKASCVRGALYGLLDISEVISKGKSWEEIDSKTVSAHYPFRAIKFNLPWFSYRSGENLSLHHETCRDLRFWESFLDMMVENKFNALTLWNLHPYIFMVRPTNFPKASPFSDEELLEWQSFWKSLFKMAKKRGIDTFIVNWNIFVSEEFSRAYNVAEYSKASGFWGDGETNKLVEQYTREIVTQTINEYEDLTGIGITLGERMGGMTSEERKDWIDRTIIKGLRDAKREARLIYRAPLSAGKTSHGTTSVTTEKITREAIENIGLEQEVLIEFKFNWSHAHSSPKVSIVHGGMLTDTYWEPESDKYKGIWTMRNEDFFVLRWAQPDFIRSFMNYNSQSYIGGCIIGSETYIPAKDYITKETYRSWDYAFERQWLFYKIWGNLLYNDQTPDSYFAESLAEKFDLDNGIDLLKAWKLASSNANRFASFYQGTWDATLYTEGFTTVGGKFIDINKLITQPVLDSSYVNIANFVSGKYSKNQITPIELADITERESLEALKIIEKMRHEYNDKLSLNIEMNDIEAWSHYGLYLASKLRGGVALQKFRKKTEDVDQNTAIVHLKEAKKHWMELVKSVEMYNVVTIPYQFDPQFSWRKHITDVNKDIEIAIKNITNKN